MSQFVTKLREGIDEQGKTGRDGINWPSPVGTWKQNEHFSRLETFAKNLDVSHPPGDTDLLNSVPTPWARLLLFESALYNPRHPAHVDVEDQWRGLLGVLALAKPLGLNLSTKTVILSQHVAHKIGKTLADLQPYQGPHDNSNDVERGKWDKFQMILVDGTVLGATSPRTLVFTGVAHNCPPSIPFKSPQGRLSDPVAYYKKYVDVVYLGLISGWLSRLIAGLDQNDELSRWMGFAPVAPGAMVTSRLSSLVERLKTWRNEVATFQPAEVPGDPISPFTLAPYTVLKAAPQPLETEGNSDLFLRHRRDVLVCFHPNNGSSLLNAFDQELINEPLKLYDGRWMQANQSLTQAQAYLPKNIKVIEDPSAFFEDTLIHVSLPKDLSRRSAVHYLEYGGLQSSQPYLFPFKAEILQYLTVDHLVENTRMLRNDQTNSIHVELKIPVEKGRYVKVVRDYPTDSAIIAGPATVGLAAWPDFASPLWKRYFYFKIAALKSGYRQLDFEPLTSFDYRDKGLLTWYVTREPADAFVGSIDGKKGLLLLNNQRLEAPDKYWQVSVDFGSTHTRAFRLLVDKRDGELLPAQGARTEPVTFSAAARELTQVDQVELKNRFCALVGTLNPPEVAQLSTLLMMPETSPGVLDNWLPREGYVYTHPVADGYDATHLRYNLKWNSHRDDPDLRAYLRCLLLMIQAEAMKQGARVARVSHSYPSVFTDALITKHNSEWNDLELYLNLGAADGDSSVAIEEATLSETVAVCRHLEWEQSASPVSNTISLDVGGSTTDVAVWARNKLEMQESVKMAAGLVGAYLQSPGAERFLKWFEGALHAAPYHYRDFSLEEFASKPNGYSLMFNSMLSIIDSQGKLGTLINHVNNANEARKLLAHIIYLYSGLLYYCGLLARKAQLPLNQDRYQIYFCGKGGTLIKWIRGYEVMTSEMFLCGLYGPAGPGGNALLPTVDTRISQMPKEEVGRGLLAKSALQGKSKGEQVGLADHTLASVTVGETGYGTLNWDDELTIDALRSLPENTVPPLSSLSELNNFWSAFARMRSTKVAAAELGIDKVTAGQYQNNLLKRFFGTTSSSIILDVKRDEENALLEPLFITEIKVLLETATNNEQLFNSH